MDYYLTRHHYLGTFRAVLMVALILTLFITEKAQADFTTVADVTGFGAATNGGGTTGTLVIGVTDLGGLLGDGEQVLGGVMPLVSPEAIIGESATAIGAVTLNDSASRWDVTGDLTVGDEGQGIMTIGTSATVDVTGLTTVGRAATGYGLVEVNGTNFPGGRLRTVDLLSVGEEGVGRIELTNRGNMLSSGDAVVGNLDGGFGTVVLADSGSRWSIAGDLMIGNGVTGLTTAHGTVEISNDALLQIEDTATMTINPRGTVDLAGGTLRVLPQASNSIINNGVIRGDGFIDGALTIGATGELRNSAGLANEREHLLVSEAVVSAGLIESIGGEMEFEQRVTSTGVVFGRDAVLRFRGSDAGTSASPDLAVNAGSLQVGGNTTIHGDVNVDVAAGASLVVFGGGPVVFVDSLTFGAAPTPFPLSALAASMDPATSTASSTFSVTLGETPALSIGGVLELNSDLALNVIYDGSVPSTQDDVLTVMTALGGVSGMFRNTNLIADGRIWDIGYLPNEVFITARDSALGLDGDFDGDGDVDGSDFLAWQRNPSLGSLADWRANHGVGGSLPLAASTVPEPSTLLLSLLTLACCPRRRVTR